MNKFMPVMVTQWDLWRS